MPDYISIHITVASRPEAEKIAAALVQEKLAACVSVVFGIRSIYTWGGNPLVADETLLIAKTRMDLFEKARKLVKTLHSHECPCIVAFPIIAGHQPYLNWISKETQQ
jgi:periplasmic divalent cation tolerance protein